MPEIPIIRCPYCRSANVEPNGKLWHCLGCNKNFEEAAVEMPPPIPKPKAKKRR